MIRRGPSERTALIGWDRATDFFHAGAMASINRPSLHCFNNGFLEWN